MPTHNRSRVGSLYCAPARIKVPPRSAADLINEVVANELMDRAATEVDVYDRQARGGADPHGRAVNIWGM